MIPIHTQTSRNSGERTRLGCRLGRLAQGLRPKFGETPNFTCETQVLPGSLI